MNHDREKHGGLGVSAKEAEEDSTCRKERIVAVRQRVIEKVENYESYRFSAEQSQILNVFFDLAQEFDDIRDLYALSITIPKVFFNLDATIFLLNRDGTFRFEVSSDDAICGAPPANRPAPQKVCCSPTLIGDRYLIPIRANRDLISQLPFPTPNDVIGLLEVMPADALEAHEIFFFEKYANRIGFQIHNRIISNKNKEHLLFIHNLVEDIGHNVIVPNMFFKLYYRRIESKIKVLSSIIGDMRHYFGQLDDVCTARDIPCDRLLREAQYLHDSLFDQYTEIFRHYENTSLFLETLLRRSHFEQGRYVLEKRSFNFKTQVIDPQIERFRNRFQERGIGIDLAAGGVPDVELQVVADIGLISQVYANLFSNAVKYTQEIRDPEGRPRKFIAYGWDILPDHFGPGLHGVKLNVFSTGPTIPNEEAARLFREGFRGGNAQGEYGTGHGLYFVKEVVGLHGGEAGYEPTPLGNNFYFILPLVDDASAAASSS